MVLLGLLFLVLLLFVGVQVYSLNGILQHEEKRASSSPLPKVSILLAARNEERNILRCLESLDLQDYPKDLLEVWIGNDQSTDSTEDLIQRFIRDRPTFKLVNIEENLGKGRGKANVLAHLAHQASGEIYLVTDADVALAKGWVRRMVQAFEPETGIVSGTTYCARGNWFETLQSIDWLHFMGYIKAFANMGISCTAVGNNMAVRKEAYWATGGFEELEFSITEDYRLFQAVTSKGWKWKTLLDPRSLGTARAIPSYRELLHQRKRWLIGAQDLTPLWKALLILYSGFTPALIMLFVIDWNLALFVWLIKFTLQTAFIANLIQQLKLRHYSLFQILLYEAYLLVNSLMTVLFYFAPIRTIWKGRTYSSTNLD